MSVIAITTQNQLSIRARHFINTLKHRGHQIIDHPECIKNPPQADIWIFEYLYNLPNYDINQMRLQYWLPQFKQFNGKIALMCLNDTCHLYSKKYSHELVENVDCVISFLKYSADSFHGANISDKMVLLPRYTLHEDLLPKCNNPRDNKIFFVGRLTGGDFFDGKNYRIEAFKKIYDNELIKQNFRGWLCTDPKHQLSPKLLENINYVHSLVGGRPDVLTDEKYYEYLLKYQISLCLPGNTAWGYRHLQSLICKNTIISYPLEDDPGEWLFQDKFNDSFYFIEKDLCNFNDVLLYALNNPDENIHRAGKSYDAYLNYFKLQNNTIYQDSVWDIVDNSLQQCGIKL